MSARSTTRTIRETTNEVTLHEEELKDLIRAYFNAPANAILYIDMHPQVFITLNWTTVETLDD